MTSKRPVTHPALQRAYSTHQPLGGPWTRHGHDIPGVTVAGDESERPPRARCGGPGLCDLCSKDAAVAQSRGRDAAIAPPDAPCEQQGGAEAPPGTTGRGEGSDATDGRAAVLMEAQQVVLNAWRARQDIEDSPGGHSCAFVDALADAGLLRDDAAEWWRAELVAIVRTVREQNDRLTRERDDLLEAVKPANDYALRKGYTTFSGGVDRVRHEVGLLARDIALAEERAEKAEAERDDLLAMKARVEIVADDLALCTCETCEGARPVGWRLRAAIRGESQ